MPFPSEPTRASRQPSRRVTFSEDVPNEGVSNVAWPRRQDSSHWRTPNVAPSPWGAVPFGFQPPPAPHPAHRRAQSVIPRYGPYSFEVGKLHKPTNVQLKEDQAAMLPLIQKVVDSQKFTESNSCACIPLTFKNWILIVRFTQTM